MVSASRQLPPASILVVLGAGGALLAGLASMISGGAAPPTRHTEHDAGVATSSDHDGGVERGPSPRPNRVAAVVVGGGPSPDANEVEIEEAVALASDVLGPDVLVLFGGGPATRAVQVRDAAPPETDPLVAELAELFAPRNGRDARYRATTLPTIHGPATLATMREELAAALSSDDPRPLTLALIGHGAPGDSPLDVAFLTWGGEAVDAMKLDALLTAESDDGAPSGRTVRVIASSCFSGGLAEIAFAEADASAGATAQPRCGLFATTWDREAAGCDPDPDRGARDGYAHHFFAALRGQDVEGNDTREAIDLDGDGVVTLLEAHTTARIASRSIDVPTTTSSRLLREITPTEGPSTPFELPEEAAVVAALGDALDERDARSVELRASELEASIAEANAGMETLAEQNDVAWTALTSELLSRWPVLDDPFHPAFHDTIANERAAIEAFLEGSPHGAEQDELLERQDALGASIESLELELALVLRLADAHRTLALAARLHALGGEDWARYEAMRACENGPP